MGLAAKASLLLVGFLLAVLAGEGLLRLAAPQETGIAALERFPAIYQESSSASYELKPGASTSVRIVDRPYSISINSHGTRGPDFVVDGSHRIVILGDSQAFGQGSNDNETMAALLESALQMQGLNVTVINAGVPGYGIDDEYLTLMDRVPSWNASLVLWMIYLGNDIADIGSHSLEYKQGRLVRIRHNGKALVDGRMMHNVSSSVGGWWKHVQQVHKVMNDHSHLYVLFKKTLLTPLVNKPMPESIYLLDTPEMQRLQTIAEALVTDGVRNSSVPVALILVPSREQLSDRSRSTSAARYRWRSYAVSQGIVLVDLFDVLVARMDKWHFPLDGHINPAGNERIASVLSDFVVKKVCNPAPEMLNTTCKESRP